MNEPKRRSFSGKNFFLTGIKRTKSCQILFFSLFNIVHFLFFIDGYTVSDVVMFWRETPVVGVEDAELPQVTWLSVKKKNTIACCDLIDSLSNEKLQMKCPYSLRSSATRPTTEWRSWPRAPISAYPCPSGSSATLAISYSKRICRRSSSLCCRGSPFGSITKPPAPVSL